MLSLPDFREKQLLFVNAEWGSPSRLRFGNDNIVFEKDKKVVNRLSAHKTFAVFIRGDMSLTTNFLKKSKEHGISIFFLKNNFEMYSGMMTVAEGHYLLREKQYNLNAQRELEMAKKLISNKLKNQTLLLKERADKNRKDILQARLDSAQIRIKEIKDGNILLGLEGNFSKLYFQELFNDIGWMRRAPRTKEDIANFLLDMGYTFLFNFVDSLLRLHGFDTYKGFYHKLFFQRRSLSCDLMEPLRYIIDRQLIKSHNLNQIDESDFIFSKGSFKLPFDKNSKYAKIFLDTLMDNKEAIFKYVNGFYRHVMNPEKYEFSEF
jgi:CRISP-associated protein Cas1